LQLDVAAMDVSGAPQLRPGFWQPMISGRADPHRCFPLRVAFVFIRGRSFR